MTGPEGLSETLRSAYDIQVSAMVQMKTVVGVVADDGMRYIWKAARPRDTEQRLGVLARAVDAMSDVALPAAGPLRTRDGACVHTLPDGQAGYVQPWLPGRHVRLQDRQERLTAVATVAELHRWSRGVAFLRDPEEGGPSWHLLSGGPLPVKLAAKLRVLNRLWRAACEVCPKLREFESAVFQTAETVVGVLGLRTDDSATRAEGDASQRDWLGGALCHRDLAPHNLLWHAIGCPVALIDFDHAGWDDPWVDLMQLSNHTFYLGDPGPGHFIDLVQAYHRVDAFSVDREAELWQVLRFPDILIRALMEWAREGSQPDQQKPLLDALQKERLRQRRWAEDARRHWA